MAKSEVHRTMDDDVETAVDAYTALAKDGYGSSLGLLPRPDRMVVDETKIVSGRIEFTSIGLVLPDNLTFDAWRKLGGNIGKVKTGLQWIIGDWVNAMKQDWGNTYEMAIQLTGMKYERLANLASICKTYEFSSRQEKLTFKHHTAVAKYPKEKRDEILAYAATFDLSVEDLRKEIRMARLDTQDKRNKDDARRAAALERRTKIRSVAKVAEMVYSSKKLTADQVAAIEAQLDELRAALAARTEGR